jgi:hypothetical protein
MSDSGVSSDGVIYFSKDFLNKLREQCGIPPWDGTQEELEIYIRRNVADAQVEQSRELLRLSQLNYDQAVTRAKEAWKS